MNMDYKFVVIEMRKITFLRCTDMEEYIRYAQIQPLFC